MKKVLNISTVQQALRRLPVAFLIAGSGFLPNASAVRYTIDFQGKAVDPQKCECFFKLLGDYRHWSPEDYWSRFNSGNCKLSIENKEEDDSYDVVFKNGSITKEESQKFPETNLDSLTFDECNGELDLSEIFQRSVGKILMEKCNFTIAENCFKYTKNFEPCDSNLFLENGLFYIPDEIGNWSGDARIILPKVAPRANGTALEAPLAICFNAAVGVLRHCQGPLGYYYGHIKFLKPAEVAPGNAGYKEKYERIKVLFQNLLKENTQLRKEIKDLKGQIEISNKEHKEKVKNMQTARERAIQDLKKKHKKKVQDLANQPKTKELKKLTEESKRKDEDIQSQAQRIKELEELLAKTKNACARIVERNKELDARMVEKTKEFEEALKNKQQEVESKDSALRCYLSGDQAAPVASGVQ